MTESRIRWLEERMTALEARVAEVLTPHTCNYCTVILKGDDLRTGICDECTRAHNQGLHEWMKTTS